jgi:hypothetical protein
MNVGFALIAAGVIIRLKIPVNCSYISLFVPNRRWGKRLESFPCGHGQVAGTMLMQAEN